MDILLTLLSVSHIVGPVVVFIALLFMPMALILDKRNVEGWGSVPAPTGAEAEEIAARISAYNESRRDLTVVDYLFGTGGAYEPLSETSKSTALIVYSLGLVVSIAVIGSLLPSLWMIPALFFAWKLLITAVR